MATVIEHTYLLTVIDSRGKFSTHSIAVNGVDAIAYLDAVDDAARGATDIGEYQAAVIALTAANFVSSAIKVAYKDDAYTAPSADANIYNFDKLTVGYKVGLDNYIVTIPARDDAAYNVAPNAVDVLIAGAGASAATTTFVAAFEAVAVDEDGNGPVDVTYMKVSS